MLARACRSASEAGCAALPSRPLSAWFIATKVVDSGSSGRPSAPPAALSPWLPVTRISQFSPLRLAVSAASVPTAASSCRSVLA